MVRDSSSKHSDMGVTPRVADPSAAAIIATVRHTKLTQKLETMIKKFAAIRSIHYLTSPDRHKWPQVRVAIYMVDVNDMRLLKSSLSNLENNEDMNILIQTWGT